MSISVGTGGGPSRKKETSDTNVRRENKTRIVGELQVFKERSLSWKKEKSISFLIKETIKWPKDIQISRRQLSIMKCSAPWIRTGKNNIQSGSPSISIDRMSSKFLTPEQAS